MEQRPYYTRNIRSTWAIVVFLIGYIALIWVVSQFYLIDAFKVLQRATPAERKLLSASSLLLLVVVLFIVGVGILLTFRVSRFFFPRPSASRTKTQYIDAWAESGKRVELKPEQE